VRRHLHLIAAGLTALPMVVACGGSGDGPSRTTNLSVAGGAVDTASHVVVAPQPSGDGPSSTMDLGIADGAVDTASHVVVEFTGVELQPSGGGNAITFNFASPKQIDLLTLQNGKIAELLSGATVPAGDYDWIRLLLNVGSNNVVSGSYIEINGAQYPLIVPSGEQTGLKLVQGFSMTANQVANFTVDFVLQQAITAPQGQQVGGVQAYLLRPALRLIDDVQAGAISGTIALSTLQGHSPSCLDNSGNPTTAHVYIFSGAGATLTDIQIDPTTGLPPAGHVNPIVTPSITYSSSTQQYVYVQPLLLTGTYTLAVACGTDDPSSADTLAFAPSGGVTATVTANQLTAVNF
jgi:hypothetical protein